LKRLYSLLSALIALCSALTVLQISSIADELDETTGMKFVQIANGGLLYDNWLVQSGKKVSGNHPAYPPEGKIKGPDTWRCAECHGWDYKGKSGAYSEGPHYTGIVGVRSYADRDPVDIIKVLKNKTHAFGDMLSENDYDALAQFISHGQVDVDRYIDRRTKKSKGDIANGGRIYLATCTACHGTDGKDVVFHTDTKPEYLGTVANNHPWETLHKIRWGHPGAPMISLVFLELKEQLDVLTFCQSLPQK
jgi:mono/diheme cytochrome c family protein